MGEALHVVWPGLLRMARDDGTLTLHNPAHGTSLDVEPESIELVQRVLDAFAAPRSLEGFGDDDIPGELLLLLVRSCFVVAVDELPFLEHGFLKPTTTPLGPLWPYADLPELAEPGSWVVLGVPVDMHALGMAGARHGPVEIRKQVMGPLLGGEGDVIDPEFGRLYPSLRLQVADLGDIDPEGGRMDHVGMRVRKVVGELLRHELRPLVLGGDHSITHYVLTEALQHVERFGVIHFDAHHDLLPSRTLSHANVFRSAVESARVQQIVQIGLRVMERMSPFAARVPCAKRSIVTARDAERGRALEVLAALPRDIPYYLSFDIDCLDGALVRETGTPALGGLSFALASELVDYIARSFDLLGADFVEVSAPVGAGNVAATMAASLLQRCLLGKITFEPLSSDVYVMPG